MATSSPVPSPTSTPDPSSILQGLLSPGAIAGIAISAAITITLLAVLCWCCCCCRNRRNRRGQPHASSSSSSHGASARRRQSFTSRLDSETHASELGFVHEPASMIEMDASGRGAVGLEEPPPPAYETLQHRRPLPVSGAMPVEMGAESRPGPGARGREGMEAWSGEEAVEEMTPGRNAWMVERGGPLAGPSTRRGSDLWVNTNVTPVIHVADENGEEDENAEFSRSISYSTCSVREAAVGRVGIPSIVYRNGAQDQEKS